MVKLNKPSETRQLPQSPFSTRSSIHFNQRGVLPLAHYKIGFIDYMVNPEFPGRSGLSDVVWDMASVLCDMGHEVHMIAAYEAVNCPDARVIVHSIQMPPMGQRNVVGHVWLLKRAAEIARTLDLDVIHTPEYLSSAVLIASHIHAPIILTVPGNIYQRLAVPQGSGYEWHYAQILKWAARRSAHSCAKIIAISSEMKVWWEKTGSQPSNTVVIPLGVDFKRFYQVDNAKNILNIPADVATFLYVGRFSREKGLLHFIDAIALAASHSDNFRVYLIGSGPLYDVVGNKIKELGLDGLCKIVPWVTQDLLRTWYSAADALVLPSFTEAMARTMGEALACGTPVIGTNTMGIADHIRDGVNGYTYPIKDTQRLADILVPIIANPANIRSLRNNARNYALDQLSWNSLVGKIVNEIYVPSVNF